MFAAWRYDENGFDDWLERKIGARASRLVRPIIITALDIVSAPFELAQRVFYRPNRKKDHLHVEDLHAKSKSQLTQTYLEACTQSFYGDKRGGVKFDPKRTYENLDVCTSGTFNAIAPELHHSAEPYMAMAPLPEVHSAPNSMSIAPRMSDSQTISGYHRSLLVRPLKGEFVETRFAATASGTFFPLSGFHQWQSETAGNPPKASEARRTKSGIHPVLRPDQNPHGLKQFIRSPDNERSA